MRTIRRRQQVSWEIRPIALTPNDTTLPVDFFGPTQARVRLRLYQVPYLLRNVKNKAPLPS